MSRPNAKWTATAVSATVVGQKEALSGKSRLSTLKGSADIPELWMALVGLWNQVRISAGGHPVAAPLLGGGLSGVGLPGTQLLQLMILFIVNETKKRKITNDIHIILADDRFDEIDLAGITTNWT